MLRALRFVVERLAAVWRAPPGASRLAAHALRDPVGDMVAWNEYAFAHADSLTMGWPFGPVNPPMYGLLPKGAAGLSLRSTTARTRTGHHRECGDMCLQQWHNTSAGQYYFGHKLPGWVRWMHLPPECRPPLPTGVMSHGATREEWRRRGQHRPLAGCTLPRCALRRNVGRARGP